MILRLVCATCLFFFSCENILQSYDQTPIQSGRQFVTFSLLAQLVLSANYMSGALLLFYIPFLTDSYS